MGRERVGEGVVERDCAVLKFLLKTLVVDPRYNIETDRRRWLSIIVC